MNDECRWGGSLQIGTAEHGGLYRVVGWCDSGLAPMGIIRPHVSLITSFVPTYFHHSLNEP